ncbi:MAG: hypothetical protein KDA84_13440, partial [Planctomycetaceae bacterium]|nr:hypothetical protein [Planctomycetaceae bacterium]
MLRFDPTPFNVLNGLAQWGLILGAFLVVTMLVSFCVALATGGFRRGPRDMVMHLSQGFHDLFIISPRRILAIAQLTIRESIRRKALLVFVLFALLFMFGSWFISDPGERPEMQAIVHITFVLKAITWLTIPVVLLLACWGLPNDIKQRSLHTVVTKPARRSEVLMGRIVGFSAIGSLILAVMSVAGYIWIKRQVPDRAQSLLVSRVPVYGELAFTDRNGNPSQAGVNTGDIWEFRSYVEGATAASAIWTFEDVTPDHLVEIKDPITGESSKALQLEYNFEAFRTHKGRMGKGLKAQFRVMNDLRTQMAHIFLGITDFQGVGEKIASGNFQEAGDELQRDAAGVQTGGLKISGRMHRLFFTRFRHLSDMMKSFNGTECFDKSDEFVAVADAASRAARDEKDEELGKQMEELGRLMVENGDVLSRYIVDQYHETGVIEVIEYKRSAKKQSDDENDEDADSTESDTTTFPLARTLSNSTPNSTFHVAVGDVFTLTLDDGDANDENNKSISFTAECLPTVGNVVDGLVKVWNDSTEEGISEITAAAVDSDSDGKSDYLTLTADKADVPIEVVATSSNETGGFLSVKNVPQQTNKDDETDKDKAQVEIHWHGPQTLDLLDDLAHGGRVRIAVACLDAGQYIGMARPDLFLRSPDRPFESGYFKAVIGTWLMVLLIVVLGVTASTFVKGPVATLLTATLLVVGLSFHGFLEDLVTGEAGKGFGAFESIVRIGEHKNPQTELEQSKAVKVMETTDKVVTGGLWVVYKTIPNFNVYGLTPYVANGFDVPFSAGLLPAIAMTLGYIFPCLFIGYFSLRLRELE